MSRSRSLRTSIASPINAIRWVNSSFSAYSSAWLAPSSSSQSCHWVALSSSDPTVALSDASPPDRRRFIEIMGDTLDILGAKIAFFQRADPRLGLAQVEEELLLRRGRAELHQAPRPQDIFLDRGADPPHGIGRKPKTPFRVEAFDRLHEAHIRLRDHLSLGQAIAAIAHGDLGGEPQVAGDELMRRVGVLILDPALGEHVFLLGLEHRELADFLQIPI